MPPVKPPLERSPARQGILRRSGGARAVRASLGAQALGLVAAIGACGPLGSPLALPPGAGVQSRIIAVRTSDQQEWRLARSDLREPLYVALPAAGGEVLVLDYAEELAALDQRPCALLSPLQAQRAELPAHTQRLAPEDFVRSTLPPSLSSQLVPHPDLCGPACATFTVEPLSEQLGARALVRLGPRAFLVVLEATRQLLRVDLERDPPLETVCDAFEVGGWRSLWLAPDGARLFMGDSQGFVRRLDLDVILREHRCEPQASVRTSTRAGVEALDGGLDPDGHIELFAASWVADVVSVSRLRDLAVTASASAPLPLAEPSYIRDVVRLGDDQALASFDGVTMVQWEAGRLRSLDVGQPLDQKIESLARLDDGRVLAAVSRHGLYLRSTAGRWSALGEALGHERVGVIMPEADRWFFAAKAGGLAQWVPGRGYCPTAFLFGDNRFRTAAVAGPGELFIADAPRSATPGDSRLVRVRWSAAR